MTDMMTGSNLTPIAMMSNMMEKRNNNNRFGQQPSGGDGMDMMMMMSMMGGMGGNNNNNNGGMSNMLLPMMMMKDGQAKDMLLLASATQNNNNNNPGGDSRSVSPLGSNPMLTYMMIDAMNEDKRPAPMPVAPMYPMPVAPAFITDPRVHVTRPMFVTPGFQTVRTVGVVPRPWLSMRSLDGSNETNATTTVESGPKSEPEQNGKSKPKQTFTPSAGKGTTVTGKSSGKAAPAFGKGAPQGIPPFGKGIPPFGKSSQPVPTAAPQPAAGPTP